MCHCLKRDFIDFIIVTVVPFNSDLLTGSQNSYNHKTPNPARDYVVKLLGGPYCCILGRCLYTEGEIHVQVPFLTVWGSLTTVLLR